MTGQNDPTWSQMNFISRLQNSTRSRDTVREYLNACGKDITNQLSRREASDLIGLLVFLKNH